jgi:hypothetical protein
VVVEMGYGVKCKLPAEFKGRLVKWQIPDPFLLGREHFRDVRDLIESEVRRLLTELEAQESKPGDGNSRTNAGSTNVEGG